VHGHGPDRRERLRRLSQQAELAAKGLFGEIIVEAPSLSAIGRYDEFIARLTGRYRLEGQFEVVELAAEGGSSRIVFQSPPATARPRPLPARRR